MNDTAAAPNRGSETWALILAGGDGTRLRAITRLLAGEPIPKQYCRITGERSMLEATLDRVRPIVPAERTMAIVNRDHLRLARPQLAALPGDNVLVQPCNRDTGPGILWSLLEIERRQPGACVAMFPSDHYVAHDRAFQDCVRKALHVVDRHPDKLVLLGVEPEEASSEYGYVLPASSLDGTDRSAFHVASFREKPDPVLAAGIVRRGGLWNSFVMVFRAARARELIARRLPEPYRALAAASRERSSLERYYSDVPAWNFSSDFLVHAAQDLAVVRAEHTGWSDWGTPLSIERTFAAMNRVPPWQVPALTTQRYPVARQTAA